LCPCFWACIHSINLTGSCFCCQIAVWLNWFLNTSLAKRRQGISFPLLSYVSNKPGPLPMFYGSTVEHRQGSMISDPHESRSDVETWMSWMIFAVIQVYGHEHITVQIYDLSYIHAHFLPSTDILRTHTVTSSQWLRDHPKRIIYLKFNPWRKYRSAWRTRSYVTLIVKLSYGFLGS